MVVKLLLLSSFSFWFTATLPSLGRRGIQQDIWPVGKGTLITWWIIIGAKADTQTYTHRHTLTTVVKSIELVHKWTDNHLEWSSHLTTTWGGRWHQYYPHQLSHQRWLLQYIGQRPPRYMETRWPVVQMATWPTLPNWQSAKELQVPLIWWKSFFIYSWWLGAWWIELLLPFESQWPVVWLIYSSSSRCWQLSLPFRMQVLLLLIQVSLHLMASILARGKICIHQLIFFT